uniref:Iron-sulfur protein n=1 Tax=Rhodococcus sp. CIR2 TaxID=90325 RepID=Q9WXG0_9NOCA|nr:iron-sulfur protein [Rhodococcus sp. CIR2]
MPNLASYKGLIFGSLDPHADSLEDYLGDLKFYLDIVLDRSDAGLQVVRRAAALGDRRELEARCRQLCRRRVSHHDDPPLDGRAGARPARPAVRALWRTHPHRARHGLGIIGPPPGMPLPEFMGLPENIVEELERRLTPEQVEIFRPTAFIHGTVFPNLSIGNFLMGKDHLSAPTAFLTLRLWHPLGPDKMEVMSFFLVEKDAPDWFKDESYKSYLRTFGISGGFEQDDAENWRRSPVLWAASSPRPGNSTIRWAAAFSNPIRTGPDRERPTHWTTPRLTSATSSNTGCSSCSRSHLRDGNSNGSGTADASTPAAAKSKSPAKAEA